MTTTNTTTTTSKFRFSIDRGGTFTDVFAKCPSGLTRVCKLLSKNDECYADAPTEGIRRIIEMDTGTPLPPSTPIDATLIDSIRMGTTVATNALLERKGEPTGLLITKGFRDLLHIGNQARPSIFDLTVTCPSQIYSEVVEVDERVYLEIGGDKKKRRSKKNEHPHRIGSVSDDNLLSKRRRVQLPNGTTILVEKELNIQQVESQLEHLLAKGINSLAVVFLHSWAFDEHELRVKELGEGMGFKHVSVSSEVMRMVRVVPRGFTTVVDSYTTPLIRDYLGSFKKGFTSNLHPNQVLFMQSDGGLTSMNRFCGSRAVLSGPAGGVVGYARTVFDKYREPVIGFDMGGTSTDVSRYDGEFLHSFENCTAGVLLQTAQLDIQTVAAGGGSILTFQSGIYNVGPESAGANPGPVAYDQGGEQLTITDANLVLNRLVPSRFPKIFGPGHDSELNVGRTVEVFEGLRGRVCSFHNSSDKEQNSGTGTLNLEEVALGFIRVANETMARPIRNITQGKGFDPSNHMLACFGGAGGQHACAIAESLGIRVVCVPRYAGVLSAVGIFMADVVVEGSEPVGRSVVADKTATEFRSLEDYIRGRFDILCAELGGKLRSEWGTGGGDDDCSSEYTLRFEKYLNMRYGGTDCSIMVRVDEDEPGESSSLLQQFCDKFVKEYSRQFGFTLLDREVVVDDLRVRGVGGRECGGDKDPGNQMRSKDEEKKEYDGEAFMTVRGYFQGVGVVEECPVYECGDGSSSASYYYAGPCLILDELSTIVVEPGWRAFVEDGSVRLEFVGSNGKVNKAVGASEPVVPLLDSIVLSVFSHRFMSIAEQMGRILQRTSVSTNIKERLDFSCAIFGEDGGLVSNAPHIPVHLGAMQEAVQYQLRVAANCWCSGCSGSEDDKLDAADHCMKLYPGDVILTNHPVAGGSHLPDLTVITPVFHHDDDADAAICSDRSSSSIRTTKPPTPIFFVANRGHHADIGGSTPGSMPPNSKSIAEEGAVFKSFKLVRGGVFMEGELVAELNRPGEVEGCSGTRNLGDNLSDLRAQVAANQKGINLLQSLVKEYSLPYVQTYMKYIQENAEVAVRDMLRSVAANATTTDQEQPLLQLSASEWMDDGTEIRLAVTIDKGEGSGVFDFSGSGWQVLGNCNAPRAITLSAVIYCLRCLVGRDVPLNQGCLRPIKIIIPDGSILAPSEDAAVVGGNVLTSQRVVDVILKAFNACAASQGCMNNITFGNDDDGGYYETVAGGAGAGPTWHGRSGVHTHMTNTRITDPEILEIRYPVILNHFSLEEGSGGKGKWRGGDGVRREILFREGMRLSVLTERRVFSPYGMEGGGVGGKGSNLLARGWYQQKRRELERKQESGADADTATDPKMKFINLGGKTSVDVEPGDLFVLLSPGGGGWGRVEDEEGA